MTQDITEALLEANKRIAALEAAVRDHHITLDKVCADAEKEVYRLNNQINDLNCEMSTHFRVIKEKNGQIAALQGYKDATLGKESERERQIAALTAERDRLRKALEKILHEVGTSTLTNKIAQAAMKQTEGEDPMNDDQRKMLTLYMGECWHAIRGQAKHDKSWYCTCMVGRISGYFEKEYLRDHINKLNSRTFSSYTDSLELAKKIVDKGEWREFHDYCTQVCDRMLRPHEFETWLFVDDPCRLPELVVKWKEGK
jgi:chromosome segregation ATPase